MGFVFKIREDKGQELTFKLTKKHIWSWKKFRFIIHEYFAPFAICKTFEEAILKIKESTRALHIRTHKVNNDWIVFAHEHAFIDEDV